MDDPHSGGFIIARGGDTHKSITSLGSHIFQYHRNTKHSECPKAASITPFYHKCETKGPFSSFPEVIKVNLFLFLNSIVYGHKFVQISSRIQKSLVDPPARLDPFLMNSFVLFSTQHALFYNSSGSHSSHMM